VPDVCCGTKARYDPVVADIELLCAIPESNLTTRAFLG
jgi:hypothetical protein